MPTASLRAAAPAEERLPDRKPHVCFVAPYAWPVLSADPSLKVVGGAEVQQCILARLLAAHGYRVSMVSFDFGQPARVVHEGIEVIKAFAERDGIPVLRFLHPRLTGMWRALREADADIYYQRSAAVWTEVVAQFCRRHGRRSIYAGASDRDFQPSREQIRFARDRWLFRRGLAHVDRVVVQNRFQLAACRRNHGRDAVLVPSCYLLPEGARRASPANETVLWVGSLHPHKRPGWLLDIAERLPHRRFVLVGGPSLGGEVVQPGLYEAVRRRAEALPNVEFTGFLPLAEVERRFDSARVLVSTSLSEGMPNVFLQAWARGVPTLATIDVGAPANTVFDDVDEGAERIERLLVDEALWRRASADSLEFFRRNHSAEEVLARYARLFAELAP
ncbi:MAG TPA: glycosyltransferase family 4 protein [Burkholderiales bacterium]